MENIFIATPRTREAHQKFHMLIDHAAVSQRNKMCVLLVAPSQSGKTKVIETFVDAMNTADLLTRRKIPVLHVTLHAQVTRKGLAQDILLALQSHGYETGAAKGGEQELWARVFRYLTVADVRLLVLDEVQHVKTSSVAMAHSVGDMIKGALNNGPCPIVLSGIQTAELPFKVNTQSYRPIGLLTHEATERRRFFSLFNQRARCGVRFRKSLASQLRSPRFEVSGRAFARDVG